MTWRGLLVAGLLALFLAAGSAPGSVTMPSAQAGPLRQVAAGQVTAFVPHHWEVHPLTSATAPRKGLRAVLRPEGGQSSRGPVLGLEAYWIDAAEISVPSDYYYLAARGTLLERPFALHPCRQVTHKILADNRPVLDRGRASRGDFVAMATGLCRSGGQTTRWASFVAAPGFGPIRGLGIPQSGLYYAAVSMPDGPHRERELRELLMRVSFGDASVSTLIPAVWDRKI